MWTKQNISDQTGKTVIVTGANSGIGFETALAFYEAGARVVLACRNPDHAEQALIQLKQGPKPGTLETELLDLASLDSIRKFADWFRQHHAHLDVLVNNAGVMLPPARKTAEGFEWQFGVNFIGHFALTGLLYPQLKATSQARIVTVTSLAYQHGTIDFDNLKLEKPYDAGREYNQSKLANLLFAVELQRRINAAGDSIRSVAAHPGVSKTELSRHMTPNAYASALEQFGDLMEPWQGALPSLYAAVADRALGGGFYGPDQDGGLRGFPGQTAILPVALDESVAQRLWRLAEQVTGISFPD